MIDLIPEILFYGLLVGTVFFIVSGTFHLLRMRSIKSMKKRQDELVRSAAKYLIDESVSIVLLTWNEPERKKLLLLFEENTPAGLKEAFDADEIESFSIDEARERVPEDRESVYWGQVFGEYDRLIAQS